MDKEMIERCSDAVDRLPAFDFNNHEREQIVMAVFKAMREPTAAMIEAGEDTGSGGIADNGSAETVKYEPDDVWQAMVDAITGAE